MSRGMSIVLCLVLAAAAIGRSGEPSSGQAGGGEIRIGFLVKMPEDAGFTRQKAVAFTWRRGGVVAVGQTGGSRRFIERAL